jgi:predicted HicB family RNase H-like nuclease
MNKPSEYGISVRLVRIDGEETYEARVTELPDVVAFGSTYGEAYEIALESIEGLQEQFREIGRDFPVPELPEVDFSGRITLRMSKSMHAAVHRRASGDGVSLNQWIVESVACRVENRMVSADHVVVAALSQVASNQIALQLAPTSFLGAIGKQSVFFTALPGASLGLPKSEWQAITS